MIQAIGLLPLVNAETVGVGLRFAEGSSNAENSSADLPRPANFSLTYTRSFLCIPPLPTQPQTSADEI